MRQIQVRLQIAVPQKVNLGEQFNLTDWSVCKANFEVSMLATKFLLSLTYLNLVYTFQKLFVSIGIIKRNFMLITEKKSIVIDNFIRRLDQAN